MKSFYFFIQLFVVLICSCLAFQAAVDHSGARYAVKRISNYNFATKLDARPVSNNDESVHFLLKEFCLESEEFINPYEVLSVPRDAERNEVRQAFLALSKKVHPDAVRNQPSDWSDEFQHDWERIKFAYEILKDKKTRQRYDRHEMIADPAGAFGRATAAILEKGSMAVGHALFKAAAFALDSIIQETRSTESEKRIESPQQIPTFVFQNIL